ncbi:hypothetical protein IAT38_003581 [Cryptococcus sp. DSM 104549]
MSAPTPAPVPRPAWAKKTTFIALARLHLKPGSANRVRELLAAIRDEAAEKEPGTLTYRTCQPLSEGDPMLVFEEYVSEEAQAEHWRGKAFLTLVETAGKEGLLDSAAGGLKIEYYEEF